MRVNLIHPFIDRFIDHISKLVKLVRDVISDVVGNISIVVHVTSLVIYSLPRFKTVRNAGYIEYKHC